MRERAGWSGVVEFSLRLQHTAILSVGTEVQGFFLFRPPIWKMPMNASCNIRSYREDLSLSSDKLDWNSCKRKTPSGIAVISIHLIPFCTELCFYQAQHIDIYILSLIFLVEPLFKPGPIDNDRNNTRLLIWTTYTRFFFKFSASEDKNGRKTLHSTQEIFDKAQIR